MLQLTDAQQAMLDGADGEVPQRMMRLLVRLGGIYGAGHMVEVRSVQVAGVSFKSIGDPGLEFLEDLVEKGARVRALTTLNPAGIDLQDWKKLGFPADFAIKQERIIEAFTRMGAAPTATCTPYLVGNLPMFGEHVAWAESSAVSYANSVLGARTNREGGPSAIAAAICGCTPSYGLHLAENRHPTIRVEVDSGPLSRADFGALGVHVGKRAGRGIPYFVGLEGARPDDLKSLGAAMAASGAVALYHVEGLTPEAGQVDSGGLETVRVVRDDLDRARAQLTSGERPDLMVIGCPHASLSEIREVAEQVRGRKLQVPLWVCTARATRRTAEQMDLVRVIEEAGGNVIADTCMVVAPIERMGIGTTAVSSGKAAQYLPGLCRQQVVFGDLEEVLR